MKTHSNNSGMRLNNEKTEEHDKTTSKYTTQILKNINQSE